MKIIPSVFLATCFCVTNVQAGEDFKLPPEVTASMRSACESDVRRLCIHANSTVETVRQCVLGKFMKLAKRCQYEIASAGLAP